MLKAIEKHCTFTHEGLQTFLCKVQLVLNGRPLTSISDYISDFESSTPNHLLIGEPSPNQSPGNYINKLKKESEISLG